MEAFVSKNSDRRQQSRQKNFHHDEREHREHRERNTKWECVHVLPKTPGQNEYLRTLRRHDVVFGLGPAGTGKTFLAVAEAVKALQKGHVRRVILTRPAVEAGERLGFLPGRAQDKVAPYLQPLFESLNKILSKNKVENDIRNGVIEIAPLAFMRGRTLEDAYVLLDEAQNCTFDQLKMLLTRLGEGSRCIITGDASQVDLDPRDSGLRGMIKALERVEGVGIYELTPDDVVRHPLVAEIIKAVADYEQPLRRVV